MPRVRRPQAGDRFDGRRLAGAVRSEDAEDLALLDGERDIVDRRAVAVTLGEVGDFDDVHALSVAERPSRAHRQPGWNRRSRLVDAVSTERLMRPRRNDVAAIVGDA